MTREIEQPVPPQPPPENPRPADASDPVAGHWLRNDAGGFRLPRNAKLAAAATACLACLGLLLGLLSWVGNPQTPILFTLMVTDQEDEGILPVPFGLEDKKLLTEGGAFDRVNSTSLESVNLDQALGILRDVERVRPSENLVLYVSARSAIDNDGKVVILPTDSRLETRNEAAELGRSLALERIFEAMARSRAVRKLLVLDIFHKSVSLPAGILNSDIPQRAEREFEEFRTRNGAVQSAPETPFQVLMTCSPGQASYTSVPLGHGVFCHFLDLALTGKLPSDARSGITRLGKVYLSDLEQVLFPHVDRWVEQNDLDRQTPVLLPRQKPGPDGHAVAPAPRSGNLPGAGGDILLATPKVRFVPSQEIAAALASTWEKGWTQLPSLKGVWGGRGAAGGSGGPDSAAGETAKKSEPDAAVASGGKDKEAQKNKDAQKDQGPAMDTEAKAAADAPPEKGKGPKEAGSDGKDGKAAKGAEPGKQAVTDGIPAEVLEAWTLFQKWTDEKRYEDHPRILNRLLAIARSGLVSHVLGLDPKDFTPRVRLGIEQAKDQMRVATSLRSNSPILFNLGLLADSGQIRENAEAITGLTKAIKEQSAIPPGAAERDQLAKKMIEEFNKAHPGLSPLEFENTLVKSTLLLPDLSGNRLPLIGTLLRQGLGQQEPKVLESRLLARLAQSPIAGPALARECLRANQVCNRASSRWRVYSHAPREMEEMMEKCLAGTWIVENCPELYGERALELFAAAERRASFLEAFNTTLRDGQRILWLTLQDIAAYQNFPFELPPGWKECAKGVALVLDRLEKIENPGPTPSGEFLETMVRDLRIEVDNLEKAYDQVHLLANPSSIADFEKLTASQKNSPAILQGLNSVIRLGGLALEDRLRLIQTYRKISVITAQATLKTEIDELLNQIPLPALPPPSPFREHGLDGADVASLNKVLLGMLTLRILAPKSLGEWGQAAENELEDVIRIAPSGASPPVSAGGPGDRLPAADTLPRKGAGMGLPSLLSRKGGLWEIFGDRDRKLGFWSESSAFFRHAFMVLVPEAMQSDKKLSYRVNLGYPGWILNPVLDDPFRNPLSLEQNYGRQKHLEWIVERLRHQSRLGLDKEFVNQVIEAMGAKFDFLKGTGIFTGPPILVPPPKVGETAVHQVPWENDGLTGEELQKVSARALPGNTEPFSAKFDKMTISPDKSAGSVEVRIERMQDTSGGLTQKPVDVVIELRAPRPLGDRYWFSVLRIGAEDDANKPKILVKSSPEGGEPVGSEIRLRGAGSRRTIYPAVRQDSGKNQGFLLSVHPQDGGVFVGPVAITTGSGLETALPLEAGAKTAGPGAATQDSTPAAGTPQVRDDGYRMDLPARLVIDLLDPMNTRTPANSRVLEISRTDPADLVELVSVKVSPDGAKKFGPDQKCNLRVVLRAKRSLAGAPPCKVAILLDQPTGSAGTSTESGNMAGVIPPDPNASLVLEAKGIRSVGLASGQGQFTLSVDGLPMTYRFRADFKPGSGLESAELVREPVLGLRVAVAPVAKPADPKVLLPEKDPPLLVEAWASQAPAGTRLRLTLLGGERFDNPEMVETLPKAMRSAVLLKPGEKGGWDFSCEEGTWTRQWPTDGLKGRKKVRLELLDKQGKSLATRETDIILDSTPPVFGQFFGLPDRVQPGATFRFTFLVNDPESGIVSVVGNLGAPAGKSPGEPATPPSPPEVQVLQTANSREVAVAVPPDAKGALGVTLKAINGAGLESTWSTTLAVSGTIPPPAPSILGTVTEGGRPQKGLTVLVRDEKGKEVAKAETDAKGAYRLDNLKPGKVSVEVTKSASRRSAKKALTLQPGPPAVADLSLLE